MFGHVVSGESYVKLFGQKRCSSLISTVKLIHLDRCYFKRWKKKGGLKCYPLAFGSGPPVPLGDPQVPTLVQSQGCLLLQKCKNHS